MTPEPKRAVMSEEAEELREVLNGAWRSQVGDKENYPPSMSEGQIIAQAIVSTLGITEEMLTAVNLATCSGRRGACFCVNDDVECEIDVAARALATLMEVGNG